MATKDVATKSVEERSTKPAQTTEASGAVVVNGVLRFPNPPSGKVTARAQLKAFVAANKQVLDKLADY